MLLREISDLHLEMAEFYIPPMKGDADTVLLLPGDIFVRHYQDSFVRKFFDNVSKRFRAVVYVPGNHEYYKGHLDEDDKKIPLWFAENGWNNIHFLNPGSIVIDDVAFIGATLWTDMNRGDPIAKMTVESGLNDYRHIRTAGYRKLRANDTIIKHITHKNYIFSQIESYRAIGMQKIVVLSHHAPSILSVHPRYRGQELNAGYHSRMEDEIMDKGPDFWFHGHMHDTFSYELGFTQVLCNPRGYSQVLRRAAHEAQVDGPELDLDAPDAKETMERIRGIYVKENEEFNPFFRIEI